MAEARLLSAGAALRLAVCALLIAFARALPVGSGVAGFAGVATMALLVLARSLVPSAGAATLTAIGAAILVLLFGAVGRGAVEWIAVVASGGMAVDAIMGLLGAPDRLWKAVAAGAGGGLSLVAMRAVFDEVAGRSSRFLEILGLVIVIEGAVGGLIGFLCARLLRGALGGAADGRP